MEKQSKEYLYAGLGMIVGSNLVNLLGEGTGYFIGSLVGFLLVVVSFILKKKS